MAKRYTYGKWRIIGKGPPAKDGSKRLRCRCLCGRLSNIRLVILERGDSRGCRSCAVKGNTRAQKLSPVKRAMVQRLYLKDVSPPDLAQRFNCSLSLIYFIVRGLTEQKRHAAYAKHLKKIRRLTPIQKGWAAGIIDGEGYIGLVRLGPDYLQPRIDVLSTTACMQKRLKRLFGGYIYFKKEKGRNQDTYRWTAWSIHHVQAVLEILEPLLVVKTKMARIVLQFCRRRMRSKFGNLSKFDENAYYAIRWLNKRGRWGK